MKEIEIHSPKYGNFIVKIDDEDYERIKSITWCIHKDKRRKEFYAWSNKTENGKHSIIKMHRFILGIKNPKIQVDHKDHNGLNNQRSNLRLATHSQNSFNKPARSIRTSKFKGVCWDKSKNKWMASIGYYGKWKFLGRYLNEVDAAMAYNKSAKELHGEFAYLNKIEKIA